MARHFALAVLTGVTTLMSLGAANAQTAPAWTGPYFGGSVGSTFATTPGSSSNFLAGAFLGSNVQMGQYVVGGETDLGWMNSHSWTWEASVRARAGALVNPSTLLYGTGGLAFARVGLDGAAAGSSSKNGYTLGGGLETAAFAGAKARLEYRYTDLGTLDGNVHARFQTMTVGFALPLGVPGYPTTPGRRVIK